jgi:hypothetical protein
MARAASKGKAAGKKAAARKAPAQKAAPKKAAVKKAAAPKTASRKTSPPKAAMKAASRGRPAAKKAAAAVKAAPKKAAVKKAAVRRAAAVASAKRKAPSPRRATIARTPRPRKAAPPRQLVTAPRAQTFSVSHAAGDADFAADGLRAYALYRDLGIADASGGLCLAHVIRLLSPCTDEVRQRHIHETELQLIYVLKGWIKNEFEGHGVQMMSAGSCWLQPPGIKHTVLDYSADCEMLEIIVPANFKTVDAA